MRQHCLQGVKRQWLTVTLTLDITSYCRSQVAAAGWFEMRSLFDRSHRQNAQIDLLAIC